MKTCPSSVRLKYVLAHALLKNQDDSDITDSPLRIRRRTCTSELVQTRCNRVHLVPISFCVSCLRHGIGLSHRVVAGLTARASLRIPIYSGHRSEINPATIPI